MRATRFFDRTTIIAFALISVFFIFSVAVPSFAHAQQEVVQNLNAASAEAGLGTSSLGTIVARILRIFFGILGVIALGLCLYAGFKWMTAQGDAKQVDEAKDILKNGVIGLIIIFSAFGISEFVMTKIFGATGLGLKGITAGDSADSTPSFLAGYSGGRSGGGLWLP